MADVVRDPVRDGLRQILFQLAIGATVLIRLKDKDRPARMPWPDQAGERELIWGQIEAAALPHGKDGSGRGDAGRGG